MLLTQKAVSIIQRETVRVNSPASFLGSFILLIRAVVLNNAPREIVNN